MFSVIKKIVSAIYFILILVLFSPAMLAGFLWKYTSFYFYIGAEIATEIMDKSIDILGAK